MNTSNQKTNQRLQFDHLPSEFRKHLKQFKREVFIPDDILSEMGVSLLDAINNQEISSGHSPIYPHRIRPDINELILWIGINFSVSIKKEPIFEPEKTSKQLCLICFDEYERYDFIWEHDIENKIKGHKDIIDITIIENYEDMLPLVISFKKTMQKKMGYLPYLGVENDKGSLFLFDKEIWRPDYEIIKNDPRISLKACICILLGIDDLSLIVIINGHLDHITEEQDRYSWEDDFIVLPRVDEANSYREVIATMKYREGWRDVISFIKKIVSEINREAEAGIIKRYGNSTLLGDEHFNLPDIDQETHKCYFETSSFLKWAGKAGYVIPDELGFLENADGTLQWMDSNTDEQGIELQLDELLLKARKEIDILYDSMKSVLKLKTKSLFDPSYEDVIDAFKKTEQNYNILLQDDINSEINFNVSKPTRDIKGGLLKNIVNRILPGVISDKTIKTDYQSLFQRSQNLIKTA